MRHHARNPNSRPVWLLLGLVFACAPGCLVTRVCWRNPRIEAPIGRHAVLTDEWVAEVETLYANAMELDRLELPECVDLYFEVAVATHDYQSPGCEERLHELHRSALCKVIEAGQRYHRLDTSRGLTVTQGSERRLIPMTYHGYGWKPNEFGRFEVVGDYKTNAFRNIHRFPGIGIPVIVSRCVVVDRPFIHDRPLIAGTVHLAFDPSDDETVGLAISNPFVVEDVQVGSQRQPLERDLSSDLAHSLRNERRTALADFIDPDSALGESRMRMMAPYQPSKIPVVLIHGLLSDPFTWAEMANELRADPWFEAHFQIWIFEYPTGQAFLSSAARLRKDLRDARQRFNADGQHPNFDRIVLVGHSMGGLVARLQVTESGTQLWDAVSNLPINQVSMRDRVRADVRESFFFRPVQSIERVVYIGTPHRGSVYARRWVGRLGASLVSPPLESRVGHRELIEDNPGVFTPEISRRIPTSIDLMNPSSCLLQSIADLPESSCVRSHSVIGNGCWTVGYGTSDGVVPVESAQLEQDVSELFIDEKHADLNKHPKCIAELKRILQTHLDAGPSDQPELAAPAGDFEWLESDPHSLAP